MVLVLPGTVLSGLRYRTVIPGTRTRIRTSHLSYWVPVSGTVAYSTTARYGTEEITDDLTFVEILLRVQYY